MMLRRLPHGQTGTLKTVALSDEQINYLDHFLHLLIAQHGCADGGGDR